MYLIITSIEIGVKIQNQLSINHLWIDFLINDFNPEFHFDRYNHNIKSFDVFNSYEGTEEKTTDNFMENEISNFVEGQNLNLTTILFKKVLSCFELQWVVGPVRCYSVTRYILDDDYQIEKQELGLDIFIRHYNNENIPIGYKIKSIPLAERTIDGTITRFTTLDGLHRLTLGVSQTSLDSITLNFSLDGQSVETSTVNFTFMNTSLNLSNYDDYKLVGFVGSNQISNVSVFINQPFPSDLWLEGSQEVLKSTVRYEYFEPSPSIFNLEDDSFSRIPKLVSGEITSYPNAFLQFFDNVTLYGSKHNMVKSCSEPSQPLKYIVDLSQIVPAIPGGLSEGQIIKINDNKQLPFFGVWHIEEIYNDSILINPSVLCSSQLSINIAGSNYLASDVKFDTSYYSTIEAILKNSNTFRKNEMVVLSSHYLLENPYTVDSQSWIVESVDGDLAVVRLNERYLGEYGDEVIIKKIPFGGCNIWKKVWVDDNAYYSCKDKSNNFRNLLIDDNASDFASFQLSNEDGTTVSDKSYYSKNFKKKQPMVRTAAIGDPYRCFIFIASKNESVSQSQTLVYGQFKTFVTPDEWATYLIAYDSNNRERVCNFNHAFEYPFWRILESGYLLCQNLVSGRSSQTDSIYQEITNNNISDAGYHIIPDLILLKPQT